MGRKRFYHPVTRDDCVLHSTSVCWCAVHAGPLDATLRLARKYIFAPRDSDGAQGDIASQLEDHDLIDGSLVSNSQCQPGASRRPHQCLCGVRTTQAFFGRGAGHHPHLLGHSLRHAKFLRHLLRCCMASQRRRHRQRGAWQQSDHGLS